MRRLLVAILTASSLACVSCSDSSSAASAEDGAEENPSYDSDFEKGGETYAEFDERRDELDGSDGTFGDYGCTEDCSGHEAGYEWAEQQGVTDPDECGGYSWSFEEGCRQYAEEQSGDSDESADVESE